MILIRINRLLIGTYKEQEAFGHDLGNYWRERMQIQLQWEFSIRLYCSVCAIYCVGPSLGLLRRSKWCSFVVFIVDVQDILLARIFGRTKMELGYIHPSSEGVLEEAGLCTDSKT